MLQQLQDYPFASRPMIIAHRGDTSLGAAENSLEAIGAAIISGADMIEIDVQWTKDEVFVCFHDEQIQLSDGSTDAIYNLTLQELRAEVYQDPDQGIMHPADLRDVLQQTKGKCYLNIEVKEYTDRDPARFMQELEKVVLDFGMEGHVLFSSFRPDFIANARWSVPTVILQPDARMLRYFASRSIMPHLFGEDILTLSPKELMNTCNATSYACMLSELTPKRVANIKAHNILLSVYTITSPQEFEQAIEFGAKALVCDMPQKFAELRNHMFPASESFPKP